MSDYTVLFLMAVMAISMLVNYSHYRDEMQGQYHRGIRNSRDRVIRDCVITYLLIFIYGLG